MVYLQYLVVIFLGFQSELCTFQVDGLQKIYHTQQQTECHLKGKRVESVKKTLCIISQLITVVYKFKGTEFSTKDLKKRYQVVMSSTNSSLYHIHPQL